MTAAASLERSYRRWLRCSPADAAAGIALCLFEVSAAALILPVRRVTA